MAYIREATVDGSRVTVEKIALDVYGYEEHAVEGETVKTSLRHMTVLITPAQADAIIAAKDVKTRDALLDAAIAADERFSDEALAAEYAEKQRVAALQAALDAKCAALRAALAAEAVEAKA